MSFVNLPLVFVSSVHLQLWLWMKWYEYTLEKRWVLVPNYCIMTSNIVCCCKKPRMEILNEIKYLSSPITGVAGILWWIVWVAVIHESPATHPTISEKERKYIQRNVDVAKVGSSRKFHQSSIDVLFCSFFTTAAVGQLLANSRQHLKGLLVWKVWKRSENAFSSTIILIIRPLLILSSEADFRTTHFVI